MSNPIAGIAHAIQANPGVFAVLVGSGLSKAAGIPTGWEVTLDLIRRVAVANAAEAPADPAAWWRETRGKEPSYGQLVEHLAPTRELRRRLLADFIEPTQEEREQGLKVPTQAHRALARLMADGFVRVVVTTNFDRLLEQALAEIGVEPTVIASADDVKGMEPLIHTRVVIVKPHGDYQDTRIKNTEDELAALPSAMTGLLARVFDEFGLIVCGWSGTWDEGLRAAVLEAPNRRYPHYWLHRGDLSEEAREIIKKRKAIKIEIQSADAALPRIVDTVEALRDLRTSPPPDVAALVALTKRYLSDPRHRIALHDLVLDEANALNSALRSEQFSGHGPEPTQALIRERFDKLVTVSTRLQQVLFTLAYYGTKEQAALCGPAMRVASDGTVRQTGHTAYNNIRMSALALPTYSLFAGSIAANSFEGVTALINEKVRKSDDRTITLLHIWGEDLATAADWLNPIEGVGRRYLPFSSLARPIINGILRSVGHGQTDDDPIFDRVEVLIALLYAFHSKCDFGFWAPFGDYVWKSRGHGYTAIRDWLDEAVSLGKDWTPLKSGLFSGDPSKFVALKTEFERFVPEARKSLR